MADPPREPEVSERAMANLGAAQPADPLERRIALLESAVRALATELEELRASRAAGASAASPIGTSGPTPQGTPAPGAVTPLARGRTPFLPREWTVDPPIDFESLIGRYGTLVLATVSALAAVGLFLGWAIDRGLLGPTQRIGLGLLTAVGLAVGGLRLRRKERSFGASLLGLSLAITHVCAWGAGPALKLVPPWGAFLLASIVSIALAVFAHAEDDEPLWSVGFSGAAIAPFVTSSGKANLLLLAAYGVAVMTAAGYAMGPRRWVIAERLFLLAASAYTIALATGHERHFGPLLATGFPLAVAALAVIPWVDGWRRRDRLRATGALAALAALRTGISDEIPFEPRTVAALLAGAGVVWLMMVDRTHAVAEPQPAGRRLYEGDWLDMAVLPLGFILATTMALDASARGTGSVMAAAAGVMLVMVTRFPQGSLRDGAVFATVIAALVAVLLLMRGRPLEVAAAVALISAACFAANVVWRSAAWTTLGLVGFAWATLASISHLTERASYAYTPFGTKESGVAAVVLASILVGGRFAGHDKRLDTTMRAGALGWAFAWVHQEFAFAISPTVSTLLLVTYYATTSVAAVWVGRVRGIAIVRHVGLALAIVAAGTALYGARNLVIGAQIGADLVAAVFLLAIAYWYRKPGSGFTTGSRVSDPTAPTGSA